MFYLGTLVLGVVLFIGGYWRHCHLGLGCDSSFLIKLVVSSVSVSSAICLAALPALWVFVVYSLSGGSIDSSMPPGFDPKFMLGLLLIGMAVFVIQSVSSYLKQIKSD